MRIGELSTATGVAVATIRFYERAGLLPPACRQPNGYRQFGRRAVDQLRFVQGCRNLGIPLADVKKLVPLLDQPRDDCAAIWEMMDEHLQQVRSRIAELQELENKLRGLQNACSNGRSVANCGILRELVPSISERSGVESCSV